MIMRRDFAVFDGKAIVGRFFTQSDAEKACQPWQHVRQWQCGWGCNGGWVRA